MVKSLENHAFRLVFVFLTGLILFSSITALINPVSVSAEIRGKQNQHDRTILYALLSCMERITFNATATESDISSSTMSGVILNLNRGNDNGDPNVPVGYEIDTTDGNARCENISLNRAMRFIDKTPTWFFNLFYDINNPSSGEGTSAGSDTIIYPAREKKNSGEIYQLMRKKGADPNKRGSGAGIGQNERERRLAIAFYQCAEPVTSERAARTNKEIGGTTYQLRESRNSDTKISVGKDWVADGKIQCHTLMNWTDKEELKRALSNKENVKNAEELAQKSGAASNPDDVKSCEDELGKLGWLVCPIVMAIEKGTAQMDIWINDLLTVSTERVFCIQAARGCSSEDIRSSRNYHAIWSSFRNIALGLIVIAILIVIISTALGFEFLDAYTVRKVLPRVLLAIVFITLSWNILEFLIILSNDVGTGIRALIYAPFSNMNGGEVQIGTGTAIITNILMGTAILGFGAMGVLSFGLTALLAVLIAFLVLVLREFIVIMLILIAPIGIACLILPNTRKGWQLWQNTLWVMLIAFTIISAMIATGRVFAITLYNADSGDLLTQLMALAAYILPYFMLPFAFRMAGGALGTLAGLANDRGRGAFDRLKNYRGNKLQDNMNKTKNFSRFPDRGPLKGINTAMGAVANPKSMLRGRGGVIAARSSRQKAYGAGFLKDNEIFQANQGDDAFLLAVANRDLAKQKQAKALKDGDQEAAANYGHALNAASQLGFRGQTAAVRSQALSALAKTGYQFSAGEEGYRELSDTARDIAGNDDGAYSSLMNEAQYGLRTASRYDLAGINHGAGFDGEAGTDKASLYELANAKPYSIKQLAENAGNGPVGEKHAIAYQELKAILPSSKGATKREVLKQMDSLEQRGVKGYLNTSTGNMKKQRVNYDNTNPAHATWSTEDRTRGWKVEDAPETYADVLSRSNKVRTYERPDPNNIP